MKKLSQTSLKTSFKEGTTLYLDSDDNTSYLLLINFIAKSTLVLLLSLLSQVNQQYGFLNKSLSHKA